MFSARDSTILHRGTTAAFSLIFALSVALMPAAAVPCLTMGRSASSPASCCPSPSDQAALSAIGHLCCAPPRGAIPHRDRYISERASDTSGVRAAAAPIPFSLPQVVVAVPMVHSPVEGAGGHPGGPPFYTLHSSLLL